mmetsp:Transcript_5003/g.7644  ORF Transcript_5003/g.7644 Transcript_5003/m.7644 type:complete len:329 (+) Transcript_5003:31-1017(+)
MNPLLEVKRSCNIVCEEASFVRIDAAAIDRVAQEMDVSTIGDKSQVAWDAEGWHYCEDVPNGPMTCQYIFVLDALNFCFWPSPDDLEYEHLATCLKNVLCKNSNAFSAESLSNISEDVLQSWFPNHTIPLISERVLRLKEMGEVLLKEFAGLAEGMVVAANGSAVKLVELILRYLPGFRDTVIYKGRLVHLYKRAQILVGDLWAAYGGRLQETNGTGGNSQYYKFKDMGELTMFADYRVPQILRQMGVLVYDPSLASKIDQKTLIPFGSEEEVEIRACTIIAVEKLKEALVKRGRDIIVIEVDWLLWQLGEKLKDDIPPHHRTLTIYY